ncbi:ATP synthase subunit C [Treponema sp.]|uniref:ATP synthase subunit C n=1 Tax=Treponema sp. TaxID=166 RepID=UPI0025DA5816|nr:ATP synthase subunit C [Treponema sp.]MCR5218795.1 ATP synthase subunit C [Treponema sp.]
MNKKFFAFVASFLLLGAFSAFAQEAVTLSTDNQASEVQAVESTETETAAEKTDTGLSGAIKYIAAAIAVGFACIGGAMAVGKIGAAAMGAMSENAELSGKALPFVGLAEGICLWGFLVALFIIIM